MISLCGLLAFGKKGTKSHTQERPNSRVVGSIDSRVQPVLSPWPVSLKFRQSHVDVTWMSARAKATAVTLCCCTVLHQSRASCIIAA